MWKTKKNKLIYRPKTKKGSASCALLKKQKNCNDFVKNVGKKSLESKILHPK